MKKAVVSSWVLQKKREKQEGENSVGWAHQKAGSAKSRCTAGLPSQYSRKALLLRLHSPQMLHRTPALNPPYARWTQRCVPKSKMGRSWRAVMPSQRYLVESPSTVGVVKTWGGPQLDDAPAITIECVP
ncbi:hypothetical protein Tdes44962_MAKER06824 [Teratosphaeria destructans]|uniref:Uncharacterized protein n=1 Tax=Teratosphaeria destructans TaxID=418781 RepID=A0A9W7W6K5_9PEZI|nr:hypothetical protein Tdes44962_MAKER06824 [Teratosphaeria destructans]